MNLPQQLAAHAVAAGWVRCDALDEFFPPKCECGPELDLVLAAFVAAGVRILPPSWAVSGVEPDESEASEVMAIYTNEVAKVPRLTNERELELAAGTNKKELVEAHLWRVIEIAELYSGCGFHRLDLIQGGNNGLIFAAGNFQGGRGYRFADYAQLWVHWGIRHELSRPKVVPVHLL